MIRPAARWVLLASCVVSCDSSGGGAEPGGGPSSPGDAAGAEDGGHGSTGGGSSDDGAPPGSEGATAPPACVPVLARCGGGAACCPGSACLAGDDGESRCVETCESRFDCGSLCCRADAAGRKVCVATDLCPPIACSDVGGECNGPGRSCCDGLTCVSSANPDYGGCRKPCQAAAECDTGCCVPYADGALGFCAPRSSCTCGGEGDSCGGTRRCCADFTCTSVESPTDFRCQPTCTVAADCSTHCCVPVPGAGSSACLPSAFCPMP